MKSDYIPSILEDADIRSVIRLLGEVAILELDLTQKKERLLSGMCRLIDGDGWAWSLTGPAEAGAGCLNRLSGGKACRHCLRWTFRMRRKIQALPPS